MRKVSYNFSIIVPAYYSSKFIGGLLSTIPKRSDVELIIIDDSKDTKEFKRLEHTVKNTYPESIVIKNRYEKGVCGARNTGLDIASGKWIIFADSDDLFILDQIDTKMDQYADSSLDQVMFRYNSKIINSNVSSGRHAHADYVFARSAGREPAVALLNTGTVYMRFISRSLIQLNHIRFNKDYRIAEDALFVTEVSANSKKYLLDDTVIYTVCDRKDSVTRRMGYDYFRNWIEAQSARNSILRSLSGSVGYNRVKQTRLVILLKALRQLGPRKAVALDSYAKTLKVPLVRFDELLFLVSKVRRKK